MNIENIKVGETYKMRKLCELLGVEYTRATNKKVKLMDEFSRYFEFIQPTTCTYLITNI